MSEQKKVTVLIDGEWAVRPDFKFKGSVPYIRALKDGALRRNQVNGVRKKARGQSKD